MIAKAEATERARQTSPAAIDVQAMNRDIARGVLALCDAISHLGEVRKALPQNTRMQAVMKHLIAAAAEVPDESWGVLFLVNNIGYDEIAKRFQQTVATAQQQVPA